ncbi:MAG: tRNA (guanine(10)-N(2))-dimethyltransferase [Methanotrichaceae archaeon]
MLLDEVLDRGVQTERMIKEGAVSFNADGAFYNPRMKLNRDISLAVVKALKVSEYLDAFAASGVRGIRVAKEADVEMATLNDVSHSACATIEENVRLNHLDNCEICCTNANVLMHQRHFQSVDLDPFGSPAPFLAAGSRSAKSYLFITATDTAPLCGAHLKSGIRKYFAVPVKTEYHREMGARILLGAAARELARIDKSMCSLLTLVADHYVRIFLNVNKGAQLADRTLEKIGYVEHCHRCGWRRSFLGLDRWPIGHCAACGEKTVTAGPLWLGPIQDHDLIGRTVAELEKMNGRSNRAIRILRTCKEEIDEPMYYDHHRLCKALRLTPGRIDDVVESLKAEGWCSSRTHFSGIGIKTDAPLEIVQDVLRSLNKP